MPINHQQLQTLSSLITDLQTRADEQEKATHANFNVFTTVLAAHDEVRLHTRFLHNMLSPEGSHDCGNLFLRLFLQTLHEVPAISDAEGEITDVPEGIEQPDYRVRKEASTSHGQIDLLLESAEYGIAIENKIYANEQPQQLARYNQYLSGNYEPHQKLLIYLTLDGKAGHTAEGAQYLRISYRKHILHWLEHCLKATYEIIPINQVLIQYRHLIQQLTGLNLAQKAMTEIKDYIKKNPNLIQMRASYVQAIEEAKADALDLLAEDLITELTNKGYPAYFRANMVEGRFGKDEWGSIRIKPKNGPFAQTHYGITIEHLSKWHALVIGIENQFGNPKISLEEKEFFEQMNERMEVEQEKLGFHKGSPSKTRKGEYWPVGWHDLVHPWKVTDEVIISLLNDVSRKELVKDIAERAIIQIQTLERVYADQQ